MIELLAAGGYLLITEGTYPVVGLGACPRGCRRGFQLVDEARSAARAHAFGCRRFARVRLVGSARERCRPRAVRASAHAAQAPGRRSGQASYIVFSDAALRDMCAKRPATDEEFLEVSGGRYEARPLRRSLPVRDSRVRAGACKRAMIRLAASDPCENPPRPRLPSKLAPHHLVTRATCNRHAWRAGARYHRFIKQQEGAMGHDQGHQAREHGQKRPRMAAQPVPFLVRRVLQTR
ncbi:MAG: HRDC domain-containing protein [Eggerthella lenta]